MIELRTYPWYRKWYMKQYWDDFWCLKMVVNWARVLRWPPWLSPQPRRNKGWGGVDSCDIILREGPADAFFCTYRLWANCGDLGRVFSKGNARGRLTGASFRRSHRQRRIGWCRAVWSISRLYLWMHSQKKYMPHHHVRARQSDSKHRQCARLSAALPPSTHAFFSGTTHAALCACRCSFRWWCSRFRWHEVFRWCWSPSQHPSMSSQCNCHWFADGSKKKILIVPNRLADCSKKQKIRSPMLQPRRPSSKTAHQF